MNEAKKQLDHQQFEELQQLLRNLGITTKHAQTSQDEKEQADQVFPD